MKRIVNAVLFLGAAAATVASAQTFTTLASFGTSAGGAGPVGSLVQATDGNFYGTTYYEGASGKGTVFEVSPSGTLTTLYSFDRDPGVNPRAGLVQATNGNLYGTTLYGGSQECHGGCGTIFTITLGGALTTLHVFIGGDGVYPPDVPVQGGGGNLYGTTSGNGSSTFGTIYKITPGGKLTTLHNFDVTDGWGPEGGMILATDGRFYGTTKYGGASKQGTVFRMNPSGTLTTLHSFNITDGSIPFGGVVESREGNLYGTTFSGGTNNDGTIFKITPGGTLTTLYNFGSTGTGGVQPEAGLIQGTDGKFYGTTTGGQRTVFSITPSGTLTTLHIFLGTDDGGDPRGARLVQGTDGNFYGTTSEGGPHGGGTIFKISLGLAPFVKTLPTSGQTGAAVSILGTDLTGATSVTFNGIAAAFTVASPTQITTTVPAGATTGNVEVTTPGGTLVSNIAFQVRP